MQEQLQKIVQHPLGVFAVLSIAAYLEVYGDACFQTAIFQSAGSKRILWGIFGALVLTAYSLFLNSSQLDFGKMLGIYVVLFFVVAQFVAKFKFGQNPTPGIYAGGALIVAGGIVMSLWQS